MFINFWYPVDLAENIKPGELYKVRMLDQNFVVFRDDDGKARCISNICIHRGGSLADGRHKGNCVECPYHGWTFNGEGDCERIPSLGPDAGVPESAKIDAYPTVEKYGLVFAFLGDLPEDERPPITPIPNYGEDGYRTVHLKYAWTVNYQRLVENQADPSHVEYVHGTMGFKGERPDYQVPAFDIKEDDWGAGAMTEFFSPASSDSKIGEMVKQEGKRDAGSGFVGIAQTWTEINFGPDKQMRLYLYTTPIDEKNLQLFLVSIRNTATEPEMDERFHRRLWAVAEEDRVVLEKLSPELPPPVDTYEMIVPADDILMIYRRKIKDWQARGWRMDLKTLYATRDRMAYAIPSPARRGAKTWPVPSVPMLAPADAMDTAAE